MRVKGSMGKCEAKPVDIEVASESARENLLEVMGDATPVDEPNKSVETQQMGKRGKMPQEQSE